MAARTASMAFSAVCLGRSVAATIRATRSTFRIGFRSFAWNGPRAATRLHRSETCEIPGCQVRAGGVGGPRPRAAGRWGRGWTASGGACGAGRGRNARQRHAVKSHQHRHRLVRLIERPVSLRQTDRAWCEHVAGRVEHTVEFRVRHLLAPAQMSWCARSPRACQGPPSYSRRRRSARWSG